MPTSSARTRSGGFSLPPLAGEAFAYYDFLHTSHFCRKPCLHPWEVWSMNESLNEIFLLCSEFHWCVVDYPHAYEIRHWSVQTHHTHCAAFVYSGQWDGVRLGNFDQSIKWERKWVCGTARVLDLTDGGQLRNAKTSMNCMGSYEIRYLEGASNRPVALRGIC